MGMTRWRRTFDAVSSKLLSSKSVDYDYLKGFGLGGGPSRR